MTIASSANRNNYVGNNSTETYSYSFKIFDEDDLKLIIKDLSDVETVLTITTDYTVTGVDNTSGGTIVLVDAGQAWMNGVSSYLETSYELTIRRVVPLTQETDIRNQGPYYPELHENQFDKLVMASQQQQDEIDRSLKIPESLTVSDFDGTLPVEIAGSVSLSIVTNAAGDGLEMGPAIADFTGAGASATAAAASAAAALVSENAAAADLVLTNADAAATAADLVETAQDVIDCGVLWQECVNSEDICDAWADATEADALSTAADVVSTNADVASTNADVVLTNADVASTNADVVLTGLDVASTNADVIAAAASAAAAATSATVAGLTIESGQSISASGEITLNAAGSMCQMLVVSGNGGAVSASLTPFGTTPPTNGAIIIVSGNHASNTVQLTHNDSADGCILNGNAVLSLYDKVWLVYNSTTDRYEELTRNF